MSELQGISLGGEIDSGCVERRANGTSTNATGTDIKVHG